MTIENIGEAIDIKPLLKKLVPRLSEDEARQIIQQAIDLGRAEGMFLAEQADAEYEAKLGAVAKAAMACVLTCKDGIHKSHDINNKLVQANFTLDLETQRTIFDKWDMTMEPKDDGKTIEVTVIAK